MCMYVCIYVSTEIYFKKLAHAIVGGGKWQVGRVAGWQVGSSGRS